MTNIEKVVHDLDKLKEQLIKEFCPSNFGLTDFREMCQSHDINDCKLCWNQPYKEEK